MIQARTVIALCMIILISLRASSDVPIVIGQYNQQEHVPFAIGEGKVTSPVEQIDIATE